MARYIMIIVLGGMFTFGISNITQNSNLHQGTQNTVDHFSQSRASNIANSMADIILMRLANDFDYRVNTKTTEKLNDGTAVYVVEDALFDGDSVVMYHWMRSHNKKLDGTPHYLIVDENKLQVVHDYLVRF